MLPILVSALVVVLAVTWLVALVRQDGYGTRPAPASQPEWGQASLPSSPFPAQIR